MKKILVLGINGFIGHHLSKKILEETNWEVFGMDMNSDRVKSMISHPRFNFFEGDEKNRPLQAKMRLNKRQISQVVDFIMNDLQGKKLSKEYCLKFFGKPTRSCDNL